MSQKLEIHKNDLGFDFESKLLGHTRPNENLHQVLSEILKTDFWRRKIYPYSYGEASNSLVKSICAIIPFIAFYSTLRTITPDELTVGLDESSKTAVILFLLINLVIFGSFVINYFSKRNKLISSILKCDYKYEIKPDENMPEDLIDCVIKTDAKAGNYICTVYFNWHYVELNLKIEEQNE